MESSPGPSLKRGYINWSDPAILSLLCTIIWTILTSLLRDRSCILLPAYLIYWNVLESSNFGNALQFSTQLHLMLWTSCLFLLHRVLLNWDISSTVALFLVSFNHRFRLFCISFSFLSSKTGMPLLAFFLDEAFTIKLITLFKHVKFI